MQKYATETVGLDIGDRVSQVCVLDATGERVEEARIATTQAGIERYFGRRAPCQVALEAGTHSRWMSELLASFGHDVLVANARMLPLIYQSDDKDDRNDAERLARIARMDPKLLKPIQHRGAANQAVLAMILSRDALVRARTVLVNHARGTVKSTGHRLPASSSERFHRLKMDVPESRRAALDPIMDAVEAITEQVKKLEKTIETECVERFPETSTLRQVGGVGSITALAFVTTIEDPQRFQKSRLVGAYLGLRPRRAKSSQSDPQLRITKAGNSYLRRLLVGSAQYILGPFGPDTDLRRWGLKLAERGGKNAKKRAVVAVARKLAVLLLSLWKSQDVYRPLGADDEDPAKTSEGTSITRTHEGVAAVAQ